MTCNEKLLSIAHIIARLMYAATNTPLGTKYPPFLCVPVASRMIICSACAPEYAYSPFPKRSKEKDTLNDVNKDQKKTKKKTCVPIPEMLPTVSSQAQHQDANGPHLGPAKCAAQK